MQKALAVFVLASACGAALAQAPARPVKAGDVHLYAVEQRTEGARFDETVTITRVADGRIHTRHARLDRPDNREGVYGTAWSTVLKSSGSGSEYNPGLVQLQHPLKVGATWDSTVAGSTTGGGRFQIKAQGTVVAQENLRTGAGEYDTYRVEMKGYVSGLSFGGGFAFEQKLWYAPAIDAIVRMEYREQRPLGANNVTELKQFKPSE